MGKNPNEQTKTGGRERESMEHLEMEENESLEAGQGQQKNPRNRNRGSEQDPLEPMEHYDKDSEKER